MIPVKKMMRVERPYVFNGVCMTPLKYLIFDDWIRGVLVAALKEPAETKQNLKKYSLSIKD